MNEPLLDPPYPGDESIDEELARRDRIRRGITPELVREFMTEALDDDWLVDLIDRLWIQQHPDPAQQGAVVIYLSLRVSAMAEQYVEQKLMEGE